MIAEIDAGKVSRLRVFKKIDQVGNGKAQAERAKALRAQILKCMVMSAVEKDDIPKLCEAIHTFFRRRLVKAELFLPWSVQQLRGELLASCEVLEEQADVERALFRERGERQDIIESLRERIEQVLPEDQ